MSISHSDDSVPPPLPPHARLNDRKNEYRPPVPPHRNIGVTALVTSNSENETGTEKESAINAIPVVQKRHHHKHHRNPNHAHNRRSQVHGNIDLIRCYDRPPDHHLNFTHEQLNLALKNHVAQQQLDDSSPEDPLTPKKIGPLTEEDDEKERNELHMAERLVENAAQQQKNAFQFDSLTPKREILAHRASSYVNKSANAQSSSEEELQLNALKIDENPEVKRRHRKQSTSFVPSSSLPDTSTINSSSDDNGGFITPPKDDGKSRRNQVKRATVVGNPMFSTTVDGDIGPGESLGLDDLDMDYEQIMHYFDNLKESNA